MKVIESLKLSSDQSYLMMKVRIVKEVKKSDGLWRFACGDVFRLRRQQKFGGNEIGHIFY